MSDSRDEMILLAHGGGGLLTRDLITDVILAELRNPILEKLDDSAIVPVEGPTVAITTDSYVVDPIFFPGGDIGRLAVCGTINDLSMQAAKPIYISLALIIEEGLTVGDFKRIMRSIGETCREAGVQVVTGDTKVVERRSRRPGIFINTTGVGFPVQGVDAGVGNARVGNAVIVTGPIGDHGMAVMNARENLGLESALVSDVAPLWEMVHALIGAVPDIRCLRDPTRGGLAAALLDMAGASRVGIRIRERDLPVRPEVKGACDILGVDPLTVANEGKAVVVCPAEKAGTALDVLRGTVHGREARKIGEVVEEHPGRVVLQTGMGGERIVDLPTGESLPRIC